MNLIQKLPIGLSLACLMFMSSCSKEDGLTPEPQMESVNAHSSLRDGPGPVVIELPYLPATMGITGANVLPSKWQRISDSFYSNDLQKFPTGTSSLTHLWGDQSKPWLKALPAVPGVQNNNSIVTVTTAGDLGSNASGKLTAVTSKIKNLIPYKKYELKVYVATTIPATSESINPAVYAKEMRITTHFQNTNNGNGGVHNYFVDLTGKQATWVEQIIVFYAGHSEMDVKFRAFTAQAGQYSYANILVDKNSIKRLD